MLRLDLGQGHVRVSLRATSITLCPLPFPNQSTQHAAACSIHNKYNLELPYVPTARPYQDGGKSAQMFERKPCKSYQISGIEQGILSGFRLMHPAVLMKHNWIIDYRRDTL